MEVVFFAACVALGPALALITDEGQARKFIENLSKEENQLCYKTTSRQWEAQTNDPAANKNLQNTIDEKKAENDHQSNKETDENEMKKYDWTKFSDFNLKRMFFLFSNYEELPDDKKEDLAKTEQNIKDTIANVKVKEYNSNDPTPKLSYGDMADRVTKNYKNADELKFYWTEYHNNAGRPVKQLFEHWLSLKKNEAKRNNKENLVKYWEFGYEVDNYEATMVPLIKAIEPLYQELHAYLRYKLWDEYGRNNDIINPKGPIPASLLGAVWGFDALALERYLPYDKVPSSFDITPALEAKGIKGKKAVETVDEYLQSLGFEKIPNDIYEKSIFEKKGQMKCYNEIYNYCNGDFRLYLCAEPNQASFFTALNRVCFVEYYLAAKDQPYVFTRYLSLPFTTAVFEVCRTLFNTPRNLKSFGLLGQDVQVNKELGINLLFKEALKWLFFLPYALAYDMWRWHVIEGKIPPQDYNCAFWKLVTEYQGVEPPVDRSNNDFDPGTQTFTASGNQTMRIFMALFLKYDILSALCREAGYYDPHNKPDNILVLCDIKGSKTAGKKLKEAMKLGSSQPWNEVLKVITGQNRMDPSALLEYYKPLQEWLHEENKKNKVTLGWPEQRERCH